MPHILHKTENGFTTRYDCSDSLRLTFGNFSVRILTKHLEALITCVEDFDLDMADVRSQKYKKPYTVHMNDGLSLGFNAEEALELKELLEWTSAALSVEDLLDSAQDSSN